MPVWGQVFMDKTGSADDVQAKIAQLIQFLKSIQKQGPAAKAGS
jgi:hypothetical protein